LILGATNPLFDSRVVEKLPFQEISVFNKKTILEGGFFSQKFENEFEKPYSSDFV